MTESAHKSPDLEDLAAYIDGRLSAERRAAVEERLVRDEDFYEIFQQTASSQDEEDGGQTPGGEVLAWRRRPAFLALATAAVLFAAAVGFLILRFGPGQDVASVLDAAAIAALDRPWSEPGWSSIRSPRGDLRELSTEELAYRLGVRLVDLRIALAVEDRPRIDRLTEDLEKISAAAGRRSIAAGFANLRKAVENGELAGAPARLAVLEERLAEGFDVFPGAAARLRLGRWTETVRLAALTGDSDTVRRLRREAPEVAELAPLLAAIDAVLAEPEPSKAKLEALADDLGEASRKLAG